MNDETPETEVDEDGLIELTADNKDEVFSAYSSTYVLSEVGDKPGAKITIRSASYKRIQLFKQAADGKSEKRLLKATCDLIAESVVDRTGDPVWLGREVEHMVKACTKRFVELQKAVMQHNGLTKKADEEDIQQLEDERKK